MGRKTDTADDQTGKQEDSLNDRKTYIQTGMQKDRETGRKRTDRHSAGHTDRQKDKQRQADMHTRFKAGSDRQKKIDR